MADLSYLIPKVLAILTAPAVDLTTISAKRVRKQLIADGESEDFLRQNKEHVDGMIAQVYESVSNGNASGYALPPGGNGAIGGAGAGSSTSGGVHQYNHPQQKRKRTPSPPPSQSYNFQSSQPQPLKNVNVTANGNSSKRGGSATDILKADAELARQLSYELNGNGGRSTRGGSQNGGSRNSTPKNRKPPGKKGGSAKKSKATIDSDGDDDGDDGSGDARPKKKAKGGFQKEFILRSVQFDVPNASKASLIMNCYPIS